ncbi:hypothetical protein BJ165DRAFT_1447625 [Panaeolus papilionaceus]|nr:hypothetical protein BJ165DRAFT_1447625 [Panaeolus papilionaceus]
MIPPPPNPLHRRQVHQHQKEHPHPILTISVFERSTSSKGSNEPLKPNLKVIKGGKRTEEESGAS